MRGIYILGMTMPVFEHDSWDIRKGTDGKWYMVDTNAETTDGEWHEIIPVPPHGRLIDADALMGVIQDYIEEYSDLDEDGMHNLKWCAMKETEMAINDAPTIVEADNNTQNMSAESEEEDA